MNSPANKNNKFIPKQALAPTPNLYDELVGNGMERLARASLAQVPPITSGSVVHDNGCGTGAASISIIERINGSKDEISIHATDIEAQALELPNDGIDAVKETYRTLKPGGTAIFNSWAYVPNYGPLQTASFNTRPSGIPPPRLAMEKWTSSEFLQSIVEKGGFEKEKIRVESSDVYCEVPELRHFANMLWSFIGGTGEAGWLESDEERWDEALRIIMEELMKTDGYKELEGGKAMLKFVANIVVAMK
ncbi:hypothetical protein DL98DRAFT_661782 [Cadophora sp. DSE1049]|nr:hypothetical protein DL98DRAFT_661782 [Cadophora sp. DSE1049]